MIDKKLIDFVRPYLKKGVKYTGKTSVNLDLGIRGEKAKFFVDKYSEIFHVDTSFFEFEKYFSEDLDLDYPLTFEDLNRCISLGSLDETTINFREDGTEFKPKYTLNKIIQGIVIFIICAILLCFVAFYT